MSNSVPQKLAHSPVVFVTQVVLVVGVCSALAWLPVLFSREETAITSYRAPKEDLAPKEKVAMEEARLWGAIVPQTADVWFFKLTGPVEDVKQLEPALNNFLQSVQFEQGTPRWNLPDGWQTGPERQMRFATLHIPASGKPLELAISKLGRSEGDWNEQLLANVNRWLDQLALPSISSEELPQATQSVEVAGVTATIVNVTGIKKPDTMGRGPFSGGR